MKSEATQIPSDEATAAELALARAQGDQYVRALQHMVTEVADDGGEQRVDAYIVAYAVEKAEGMYMPDKNGELVWHEPTAENMHVEVSVRDAADNRFVPGLIVHARLTDSQGRDIGRHRQPFLWHPWLAHYGRNWAVPHSGDYTLDITIQAPDFPRHDKKNGKRFSDDVEVSFTGVKMKID